MFGHRHPEHGRVGHDPGGTGVLVELAVYRRCLLHGLLEAVVGGGHHLLRLGEGVDTFAGPESAARHVELHLDVVRYVEVVGELLAVRGPVVVDLTAPAFVQEDAGPPPLLECQSEILVRSAAPHEAFRMVLPEELSLLRKDLRLAQTAHTAPVNAFGLLSSNFRVIDFVISHRHPSPGARRRALLL